MTLRQLFLALALLLTGQVQAQGQVLIVREEAPVLRQTAAILVRELPRQGWSASEQLIGAAGAVELQRDPDLVLVGLGARAFSLAASQAAGRPVVGGLIARAALDERGLVPADRWTAILLDQPLDRWLSLIRLAFPDRGRIGVILGPDGQRQKDALERRVAEHRMSLATEAVGGVDEVVPALERLLPRMSLLLALPDGRVHNRNTVQPLLLTTYRAAMPVVAYSESYQQAGAALVLYSTPAQIAGQIVESIRTFAEGRVPPVMQPPRHFTVGVNTAVARSLGLQLPPATELEQGLRQLDQ